MRILLITAAFPPMRSGGADYALRLAQEMNKVGQDVAVLTSQIPGCVQDPQIQIMPLLQNWGWRHFPIILRTLAQYKPDVVNLHFSAWTVNEHPMITFLPEFIRRVYPKLIVITHIESHVGLRKGRIGRCSRIIQQFLRTLAGTSYSSYEFGTVLRSSHKIVVLSTGDLRVISQEYPEASIKTVLTPPPPIMPMVQDNDHKVRLSMRFTLGLQESEFLVAFYGYVYPGKGIEALLEACNLLIGRGRKLKLIFVGDVPESYALTLAKRPEYRQDLRHLVSSMGLEDRVIWSGYIASDSDMASRYLRAADVACVPFRPGIQLHRSSFSYLAAHGLPIVSTHGEDTEDVFLHGENLLLCPPEDAKAIADSIDRLFEDKSLCKKIGQGAIKLHQDLYTWKTTVARTLAAIIP